MYRAFKKWYEASLIVQIDGAKLSLADARIDISDLENEKAGLIFQLRTSDYRLRGERANAESKHAIERLEKDREALREELAATKSKLVDMEKLAVGLGREIRILDARIHDTDAEHKKASQRAKVFAELIKAKLEMDIARSRSVQHSLEARVGELETSAARLEEEKKAWELEKPDLDVALCTSSPSENQSMDALSVDSESHSDNDDLSFDSLLKEEREQLQEKDELIEDLQSQLLDRKSGAGMVSGEAVSVNEESTLAGEEDEMPIGPTGQVSMSSVARVRKGELTRTRPPAVARLEELMKLIGKSSADGRRFSENSAATTVSAMTTESFSVPAADATVDLYEGHSRRSSIRKPSASDFSMHKSGTTLAEEINFAFGAWSEKDGSENEARSTCASPLAARSYSPKSQESIGSGSSSIHGSEEECSELADDYIPGSEDEVGEYVRGSQPDLDESSADLQDRHPGWGNFSGFQDWRSIILSEENTPKDVDTPVSHIYGAEGERTSPPPRSSERPFFGEYSGSSASGGSPAVRSSPPSHMQQERRTFFGEERRFPGEERKSSAEERKSDSPSTVLEPIHLQKHVLWRVLQVGKSV